MLFRLLIFSVLLIGIITLWNRFQRRSRDTRCDYCRGLGYWEGTRGEKNFCKRCDGTGRIFGDHH